MKDINEMSDKQKSNKLAMVCGWEIVEHKLEDWGVEHLIKDTEGDLHHGAMFDHENMEWVFPDLYHWQNQHLTRQVMRWATRSGLFDQDRHHSVACEFTYGRDGVRGALDTVLSMATQLIEQLRGGVSAPPKQPCPNCDYDRWGLGSYIVGGMAFCDEQCYLQYGEMGERSG